MRIDSSRLVRTVLWLTTLTLGTAPDARAQDAFFDEGNQLYQNDDFAGALDRYQRILDEGLESGELHYNIGNTHFKLGNLGRAIVSYERAWRLMPRDDDVLANLELARSMTADNIAPLPRFWLFRIVGWWVALVSRTTLSWLVSLAYVTTAVTVITVILRPTPIVVTWIRRLGMATGAITLLFGLNLIVRELGVGTVEEAVIVADEVQVQSAPSDDDALGIFQVHEGTKVRLDRRSDEWVEIVLEDGTVGWIRAKNLETI